MLSRARLAPAEECAYPWLDLVLIGQPACTLQSLDRRRTLLLHQSSPLPASRTRALHNSTLQRLLEQISDTVTPRQLHARHVSPEQATLFARQLKTLVSTRLPPTTESTAAESPPQAKLYTALPSTRSVSVNEGRTEDDAAVGYSCAQHPDRSTRTERISTCAQVTESGNG